MGMPEDYSNAMNATGQHTLAWYDEKATLSYNRGDHQNQPKDVSISKGGAMLSLSAFSVHPSKTRSAVQNRTR